jgi:hypothetical protein
VINSGDPIASGLFRQFQQQRMPDWTDLSEQQIGDLLDWFAAGGPDQAPPDERNAELATPAEIAWGKALFSGAAPLSSGALWCASCHRTAEDGTLGGGSLGPDLTTSYPRYRDRALTLFLRQP